MVSGTVPRSCGPRGKGRAMAKRDLLLQVGHIKAVLSEHGVIGHLSDVSSDCIEFEIKSSRSLDTVIGLLFMREGIDRVWENRVGRSKFLKIEMAEELIS